MLSVAGFFAFPERFPRGGGFILRRREASFLSGNPLSFNDADNTAVTPTNIPGSTVHTGYTGRRVYRETTYLGVHREAYREVYTT